MLRKHMPELDVWRGVAVASVLFYHSFMRPLTGYSGSVAKAVWGFASLGWLGVNLFFILSGFLITGILLDSKSRVGYYGRFYSRRVRRIVPAYVFCILMLTIFNMISSGGVVRAVTFLANYNFIPAARSYGPLWSLSVEEQFYLIWPTIILFLSRRGLIAVSVLICVADPILRYYSYTHGGFLGDVHESTPLIVDSFALGALGALLLRWERVTKSLVKRISVAFLVAGLALLVVVSKQGLLHRTSPVGAAIQVVPFIWILFGLMVGSLATGLDRLPSGMLKGLSIMGDISYGLYLYHIIVFTLYDRFAPPQALTRSLLEYEAVRALVCWPAAILLAWASRWYLEERFLNSQSQGVSMSRALRLSKESAT